MSTSRSEQTNGCGTDIIPNLHRTIVLPSLLAFVGYSVLGQNGIHIL